MTTKLILSEQNEEDNYSPEYPLGGTLEHYDIEKERILVEGIIHVINQLKQL